MPDAIALVLSNSEDATADYLCRRLKDAGVGHVRLDTDRSLDTVRLGLTRNSLVLSLDELPLRPDDIRAIVYRRPKPFAPNIAGDIYQQNHAADEWAEAVEGFLAHVPPTRWINHPAHNFNASHKVHQLTRAQACGLSVPPWIVTTVPEQATAFRDANGGQIVAKPLASGYIERSTPEEDTLIYTCSVAGDQTALFDRLPACPVLFQARLDKQADVRLIVVDHRMIAVSMVAIEPDGQQRLDIRRDNMQDVEYGPVAVPADVAHSVRMLMSGYSLRFAAIDFAIDVEGNWTFFEINPNGQWAWLDLAGATDIGQMFIEALDAVTAT